MTWYDSCPHASTAAVAFHLILTFLSLHWMLIRLRSAPHPPYHAHRTRLANLPCPPPPRRHTRAPSPYRSDTSPPPYTRRAMPIKRISSNTSIRLPARRRAYGPCSRAPSKFRSWPTRPRCVLPARATRRASRERAAGDADEQLSAFNFASTLCLLQGCR